MSTYRTDVQLTRAADKVRGVAALFPSSPEAKSLLDAATIMTEAAEALGDFIDSPEPVYVTLFKGGARISEPIECAVADWQWVDSQDCDMICVSDSDAVATQHPKRTDGTNPLAPPVCSLNAAAPQGACSQDPRHDGPHDNGSTTPVLETADPAPELPADVNAVVDAGLAAIGHDPAANDTPAQTAVLAMIDATIAQLADAGAVTPAEPAEPESAPMTPPEPVQPPSEPDGGPFDYFEHVPEQLTPDEIRQAVVNAIADLHSIRARADGLIETLGSIADQVGAVQPAMMTDEAAAEMRETQRSIVSAQIERGWHDPGSIACGAPGVDGRSCTIQAGIPHDQHADDLGPIGAAA